MDRPSTLSLPPLAHTPGPWRVLPPTPLATTLDQFVWTDNEVRRDDHGGWTDRCVARVLATPPSVPRSAQSVLDEPYDITANAARANAQLIATAPTLLAALQALDLRCQCDVHNPCWNDRPTDVPGKHWGGGTACPPCTAKAAIVQAVRP